MAERADITLTVGGTAVGKMTDASVQMSAASLPAAAEDSYGYARVVPGVIRWAASGSTFLPSGGEAGQAALRTALTGRSSVAVVVTFETGETETGTAYVATWDASGEIGAAVTGSFQLTGSGALVAS